MNNNSEDRISLKSIQPDNEMVDALIYSEFSKGNPNFDSVEVILDGFIAQVIQTVQEKEAPSKVFYIDILDALFSFSNGIRQKYSEMVSDDFRLLVEYISYYKHSKEDIEDFFFNEDDEYEGVDDLSQTEECFHEQ